jgi:hypothetical protein
MDGFETLNDACIDAVRALGGSKVVGPMLWPEKDPVAAARLLRDSLNENRAERLCPDQLMLIARKARERGNHSIMNHFCESCGYADPVPVEPEAELAGLLREFNANSERQAAQQAKIERLLTRTLKAKVA